MPNYFGFNHVIATDDPTNAVGGEFNVGSRRMKAPIAIAKTLDKLSRGPAQLSDHDRGGLDVLGIPHSTGANGYTSAHEKIALTTWFELPQQPTAPDRPVPTVTLPWPKRR